ncbi:MAG TPA: AAA family ATPase [Candidatus Goldiibacteriota bacterium]|nr:AAA family ATPase [Candidatus Goldiibacteriota bacterium]
MSYEQFFGLTEQPFSNAPDSRYYYDSDQHQEALTRIMHAADTMKGLVVLLGEIGTGKTLLARKALEKMEQQGDFVESLLVIVHSEINASWLLNRIAKQIGIENPAENKEALLPQFYKRLMEIYESGKKAVVVIDEANMLKTREIFEEFRGLLNLEIPGRKLLTLVLIGMPELEKNIALDPPLEQRVALKFRLKALGREATANYIRHRMKVAGANREIFSDMAIERIYEYSKGTPRIINVLCDNALLETFLTKNDRIGADVIDSVASDLGYRKNN